MPDNKNWPHARKAPRHFDSGYARPHLNASQKVRQDRLKTQAIEKVRGDVENYPKRLAEQPDHLQKAAKAQAGGEKKEVEEVQPEAPAMNTTAPLPNTMTATQPTGVIETPVPSGNVSETPLDDHSQFED